MATDIKRLLVTLCRKTFAKFLEGMAPAQSHVTALCEKQALTQAFRARKGHSLVIPVRMLMMEKEMAELVNRLKSRLNSCLYPAKQAKHQHDSLSEKGCHYVVLRLVSHYMLHDVTAI